MSGLPAPDCRTPRDPGPLLAGAIRLASALTDAFRRGCERRQLMRLSDRQLLDIGVSRADAWAEYRKPFWRD